MNSTTSFAPGRACLLHVRELSTSVARSAGPPKGDPSEFVAFVEDPDGYRVELIERTVENAGYGGPR